MLVLSPDARRGKLKAVDVVGHQLGFACPRIPKAGGVAVGVTIGILLSNARLMSATGGASAALPPLANRVAANRVILAAPTSCRVIEPAFFFAIATYVRSLARSCCFRMSAQCPLSKGTRTSAVGAERSRLTHQLQMGEMITPASPCAWCREAMRPRGGVFPPTPRRSAPGNLSRRSCLWQRRQFPEKLRSQSR
jgi:hypothetical protein